MTMSAAELALVVHSFCISGTTVEGVAVAGQWSQVQDQFNYTALHLLRQLCS